MLANDMGKAGLVRLSHIIELRPEPPLYHLPRQRNQQTEAEQVGKKTGREQNDSANENEQTIYQFVGGHPPGCQLILNLDPYPETLCPRQCCPDDSCCHHQKHGGPESDFGAQLDQDDHLHERETDKQYNKFR